MRQDQDKTKGKKRKKKRKKTDSPHGFSVNYSKRHLLASKHTPKESPLWACNEVTTTALMKISSSRLERAFTHRSIFQKMFCVLFKSATGRAINYTVPDVCVRRVRVLGTFYMAAKPHPHSRPCATGGSWMCVNELLVPFRSGASLQLVCVHLKRVVLQSRI